MDTLKDPYFDMLVSRGALGFADLAAIDDRIEKGLKIFLAMLGHL